MMESTVNQPFANPYGLACSEFLYFRDIWTFVFLIWIPSVLDQTALMNPSLETQWLFIFTDFHPQNKHFWTYRAGRVAIVQYLALLRFFLDMSISTASWSYRLTSLQLEGPFLHSELEGFPCVWQHMTAQICTGEHFDAPHCSDLQHRALQNVSREAGEQLGLTSWRRLMREVWKTYWFITTVGSTNPLKRDHYIIEIVDMRKMMFILWIFYGVTTKKWSSATKDLEFTKRHLDLAKNGHFTTKEFG